jgi:inorganic pyrophosphatase
MGADLFGSFAESTCAALVIAAQTEDLRNSGWGAVCFPLTVSSIGIIMCFFTSFVATHIHPVVNESRIELALRLQLIITTFLMIPATIYVAGIYLPSEFMIEGVAKNLIATRHDATVCVIAGAVGGLIIGLTTEFYTSKDYGMLIYIYIYIYIYLYN